MQEPDEQQYTVRFPRDLLEKVRQRAKRDRRSINQEIIWLIEEAMGEGHDGEEEQGQ
jgi:hypothetical protein